MREKDDDLYLSPQNLKISQQSQPISESSYHMVKNCNIYNIDGVKVPLFVKDFSFLKNSSYLQTIHKVERKEVGRLDKISHTYYKTPELWWLIAEVNNLDPFEVEEGQEIMIPSLQMFDFQAMAQL